MLYNPNITYKDRILDQFEGFSETRVLDGSLLISGRKSFELKGDSKGEELPNIPDNLPLGKRAEYFAKFLLERDPRFESVNWQLQFIDQKVTIGEIDFLLKMRNQKLLHLELAYKLYLEVRTKDTTVYIGPNRKDYLHIKLKKLEEKQFPIINTPTVSKWIEERYGSIEIEQRLWLKAQLFKFLEPSTKEFPNATPSHYDGYWFTLETFREINFNECHFFIPEKQDWLVNPTKCAEWLDRARCENSIEELQARKFSPMVWIKNPNGFTVKCFIVWWKPNSFS